MLVGDGQKTVEELYRIGAAPNGQEIDQLDQQLCLASAFGSDTFNQFLQTGNETVVTNPQQRAAGNIPDSCSFNHNCTGASAGKAAIPVQNIFGDKAVIGCPPWNHRRYPCPGGQSDRTDRYG